MSQTDGWWNLLSTFVDMGKTSPDDACARSGIGIVQQLFAFNRRKDYICENEEVVSPNGPVPKHLAH